MTLPISHVVQVCDDITTIDRVLYVDDLYYSIVSFIGWYAVMGMPGPTIEPTMLACSLYGW